MKEILSVNIHCNEESTFIDLYILFGGRTAATSFVAEVSRRQCGGEKICYGINNDRNHFCINFVIV
jgi:hypothetical protein